jgi:two-component system OmpR family sensor kinase
VYTAFVGNNLVQVSQPMKFREEFAEALAWRTLLPLLALLPVLMALVWLTVGRALKPLTDVALAVGKRSADALEPLPQEGLPSEVKPLVTALNALLSLLGQALKAQRSFIADAAHEMRTPLTAVQLQIQLLERAASEAERTEAFTHLKAGVERTSRLVRQLLSLARSEPEGAEHQPFARVELARIAREVVSELAPIAAAKGIDLGLTSADPAPVNGDAETLRMLINNLVDNALQYTPRGGTVDVKAVTHGGRACLIVTDTGRGIPPAARERVFDRFYRHESAGVTGSGLGLSIVRKVAERHGATVELDDGPLGRGLKVTVAFQAA